MYIQGNPKISIIQGDSYTNEISFEGIGLESIKDIFFTCSDLSICKKLERDVENNVFILHLTSNNTINYNVGTYNYDLTIQFIDDQYKTIQYQSIMSILEKTNKVICYD